jgi:amino acid transporter
MIGAVLGVSLFARQAVAATALTDPLGNVPITTIIGRVVAGLLGISGAVALLVFVWSGLMMMVAAGNPDKIKKAKNSLIWATIGLVVIFTAYALVATLINVISTGAGQ